MSLITDLVNNNVLSSDISAIKEMSMLSSKIPGVANLSWGLPSFQTPAYIRDGIKKILDNDVDAGKYTLPAGLPELREQVVKTHFEKTGVNVDADQHVMIGAGNMQSLNTIFHTILDAGDEIILTDPCFASHIQQIHLFQGIPVYWPLDESKNWSLDIDGLPSLITEKTQAIVLVSPSNPTGKIFTEDELMKVGQIAEEHNILVIVDDPYSDFIYDNKDQYFNLASVKEYQDNIVYMYSFSKAYAMSGWRLSYCVMPAELKQQAMKVHDATMICAPRISQLAGLIALRDETTHKREFMQIMQARRSLIDQRIQQVSHVFESHKPEGAYYLFPKIKTEYTNSREFAIDLLKNAKVAVTPGSAFGPSAEGHVRIAYCVDEEVINRAFDRIEQYF